MTIRRASFGVSLGTGSTARSNSHTLAVELGAELARMDERDGRRFAQRLGLRPIGIVGILLEAKKIGLLDRIRPCLDALRHNAGFYVGDGLSTSALELAGE